MANLIFEAEGVRGRHIKLYDTVCTISTKVSMGSLLTGNATDGEKTIFLNDVVGVQFKKSGGLIGYLQFETPSSQMNNQNSNMFSENTFTFEQGKNGLTNEIMEAVYQYLVARIDELKNGSDPVPSKIAPPFAPQNAYQQPVQQPMQQPAQQAFWFCSNCGYRNDAQSSHCPQCGAPR